MTNQKKLWRICVIAVVLIAILVYSPLITKAGKTDPFLFGMPFTLWTSMLLTIFVVALTYVGGLFLPNDEEGSK